MKRYFSLLLVLALFVCLFGGCGKDNGSSTAVSDGQSNNSVGDSISLVDVKYIDENNESVYGIIRPINAEFNEDILATEIFKSMRSALGVKPKNTDDSSDGTNAFEILIGATNRAESQQALDYMVSEGKGRYTDFIICTIGKKIVINANTAEALKYACEYFVQNYLNVNGVKGGIKYIYAPEGDYTDIMVNGENIGRFNIIRPHLNSSYLAHIETEKVINSVKESTGYILKLLDDEYTKAGEYEIIIGDTNRADVEKIDDLNEYRITVKGKKVFLNGGSPHATAMAVSEFGKLLSKGAVTDADSCVGDYNKAIKNYDKSTTYTLTWYDEFEGNTLDTAKWRMMGDDEFGREGQNGKLSLMSNDPKYVYQKDGHFYIHAQEKEDSYYGGCILTDTTFLFRYGYVEMSALCPDGPGFWSVIYFYQPDHSQAGPFAGSNQGYWKPEIDLNECFGNGRITYFNCHAHTTVKGELANKKHYSFDNPPYNELRKYYCPDDKTFADDFHTYGLIWDETQLTMVADGKIHFAYEFSEEYDVDAFVETFLCMKIAFSVARENNNLNINEVTPEQWANSSKMIVDYVYLYQLQNGIQDVIHIK